MYVLPNFLSIPSLVLFTPQTEEQQTLIVRPLKVRERTLTQRTPSLSLLCSHSKFKFLTFPVKGTNKFLSIYSKNTLLTQQNIMNTLSIIIYINLKGRELKNRRFTVIVIVHVLSQNF